MNICQQALATINVNSKNNDLKVQLHIAFSINNVTIMPCIIRLVNSFCVQSFLSNAMPDHTDQANNTFNASYFPLNFLLPQCLITQLLQ